MGSPEVSSRHDKENNPTIAKSETPTTVSSSSDNNNENGDDESNHHHDASAEAAGFVRGITRSLGRSVASRLPIGQLPRRAAPVLRRRLPVRQIAKVSDRISTGLDWWSSAVESEKQQKRRTLMTRVKAFTTSVVKNTLLGAAVFETYGFVVSKFAPPPSETDEALRIIDASYGRNDDDTEESPHEDGFPAADDEYARASLPIHFGAGFVAGSVHGIVLTIWETKGTSNILRSLPAMTAHHAIAHSVLFGSYETIKRSLFHQLLSIDDRPHYYGQGYLACFALAGGWAGQIQHLVSHYTEYWLGITAEPGGISSQAATTLDGSGTQPIGTPQVRRFFSSVPAPSLRPFLLAFPPSAIGFVAFEYGKKFMT